MAAELQIEVDEPVVVSVSGPDEQRWGVHQFPMMFRLDDGRIGLTFSEDVDSTMSYGLPRAAYVSADRGRTWVRTDEEELTRHGAGAFFFPDGEAVLFQRQRPVDASTLDLPDRFVEFHDDVGRRGRSYRLADLPPEFRRVPFLRRPAGVADWREGTAVLDVPDLALNLWTWEAAEDRMYNPNRLVQPFVNPDHFWTVMPDGTLLNFQYDKLLGEYAGQDTSCGGSCFVLASRDRGRTWRLHGVPGRQEDVPRMAEISRKYLEDGASNYNRLWGGPDEGPVPNFRFPGFYEPAAVSYGDGRMVCVLRTDYGGTHQPMFVTRSSDWGRTWSAPEILTPFGAMPRMTLLDNGVIVLLFGRPGIHLLFSSDGSGARWHDHINLLPESGEKTRETRGPRGMVTTAEQAGHDDTCGNCALVRTGGDTFLAAYSDFRHRDAKGRRRKAVKVQQVHVSS